MSDHFSPEIREWLNKQYADEKENFGALLDAKILEAQSLRLIEGHKARERTLQSLGKDACQYRSQAAE